MDTKQIKRKQIALGELKLVRWVDDGFPPIDLNANIKHVVELVSEIKRLRKELNKK